MLQGWPDDKIETSFRIKTHGKKSEEEKLLCHNDYFHHPPLPPQKIKLFPLQLTGVELQ